MRIKLTQKQKKCLTFIIPVILVGLLAVTMFRNTTIFIIFLLLNAGLNYYQGEAEFPFDMSPSLVLTIIFSLELGLSYGLFFMFLGSIIPSVIAKGFDHTTPFFVLLAMFIAYLASLGLIDNILHYGLGLIVLQSVVAYIIGRYLTDEPEVMFSVFLGIGINIVYLLILAEPVLKILI